ncbi:hypothetical protein [Streptomyces capitiformicae]|uniref:hypothetical protein n=1 Tax=Streptomyces capitiformicae TaxID=2014920 RepID=UPI0016765CEB|nr:hypothetical protein [Streptomyces capitiformicae]
MTSAVFATVNLNGLSRDLDRLAHAAHRIASDEMVEGWTRQRHSRMLRDTTIGERARLVRRFAEFTGRYPWQWAPSGVEAFISELRSGSKPVNADAVRCRE